MRISRGNRQHHPHRTRAVPAKLASQHPQTVPFYHEEHRQLHQKFHLPLSQHICEHGNSDITSPCLPLWSWARIDTYVNASSVPRSQKFLDVTFLPTCMSVPHEETCSSGGPNDWCRGRVSPTTRTDCWKLILDRSARHVRASRNCVCVCHRKHFTHRVPWIEQFDQFLSHEDHSKQH